MLFKMSKAKLLTHLSSEGTAVQFIQTKLGT